MPSLIVIVVVRVAESTLLFIPWVESGDYGGCVNTCDPVEGIGCCGTCPCFRKITNESLWRKKEQGLKARWCGDQKERCSPPNFPRIIPHQEVRVRVRVRVGPTASPLHPDPKRGAPKAAVSDAWGPPTVAAATSPRSLSSRAPTFCDRNPIHLPLV
jgi:hypothetical protein